MAYVSQVNGVFVASKVRITVPMPFVKEIHRWRVDFSHKGTVTQNTFSFDDVIMLPFLYKRPDGITSSAATLTLGPEIEPLGHIIEIHIKIPPINIKNKNDGKPMENIWENDWI